MVVAYFGLVNKGSPFAVRREHTSGGIFQAFDDCLPVISRAPRLELQQLTVFPEPLSPTMSVKGVEKCMNSALALSKERTLQIIRDDGCGIGFVLPLNPQFLY